RSYVSGSIAARRYNPWSFVITSTAPLGPTSVIVAPDRSPPCASRTVPPTLPVSVWPSAAPAHGTSSSKQQAHPTKWIRKKLLIRESRAYLVTVRRSSFHGPCRIDNECPDIR